MNGFRGTAPANFETTARGRSRYHVEEHERQARHQTGGAKRVEPQRKTGYPKVGQDNCRHGALPGNSNYWGNFRSRLSWQQSGGLIEGGAVAGVCQYIRITRSYTYYQHGIILLKSSCNWAPWLFDVLLVSLKPAGCSDHPGFRPVPSWLDGGRNQGKYGRET
jgi:hypothetical protein